MKVIEAEVNLYDSASSRLIDKKVVDGGVAEPLLIMRAASEVWMIAKKLAKTDKIWCFAGSGNNGADAVALSGLALISKKDVSLILAGETKLKSKLILNFVKKTGISPSKKLPSISDVSSGDLIIDGLLGTGITRAPDRNIACAINWMNKARKKGAIVVSIDVPSGLDASSGEIFGVTTVQADATVMCLSQKQGCYTGQAPDYTGKLYFSDLGIKSLEKILPGNSILLSTNNISSLNRSKTSHKGSNGSVLVLGGWDGMEGAGCLSAIASLKVGAGKVFICGPEFSQRSYELIGIPKNLEDFSKILTKMDCLVVGPGLGDKADDFILAAWNSDIPMVLDADGLRWLGRVKPCNRRQKWIGTPHPGEAKFLLNNEIRNRFTAVKRLKSKFGGEWVLKGPGTLVTYENSIYVNPFADGILATAGSGDILAGIIGGLIAQKMPQAALVGVWLHSESARLLLKDGEVRILASGLLDKFSEAIVRLDYC